LQMLVAFWKRNVYCTLLQAGRVDGFYDDCHICQNKLSENKLKVKLRTDNHQTFLKMAR